MFILSISHGHEWGFTSIRIFSLLFFSLLSMIFFIWIEKKMDYPVFQPSLLRIRLFFLPIISASILFTGLYTMTFLMPFYLVYPHGLSIDTAGYIMVVPFAFLFFASPVSGYLSDRIGSRILCTLGMFVLSSALLSLSVLTPSNSYFSIAWRLGLVGLGVGIFTSPNNLIIISSVKPAHRGIASGAVATSRNLGMVMGIALSGVIFNSVFYRLSNGFNLKVYRPEFEIFFMTSFKWAMFAGGIAALTGVIVAFLRGPELKKTLALSK
jgi:MFS family permease